MSSQETIISKNEETPRSPRRKLAPIWIAALLAVGLLFLGTWPRLQRQARAAETAKAAAESLPRVSVVQVKRVGGSSELELPGNLEPITVASVYARTSGYIRERFVDIGSHVRTGQLLALIETPEVDQELAQARASLEQTRATLEQARASLTQAEAQVTQAKANVEQASANEEIAATTNDRWTRLVKNGVVPKQDSDERRAAYNARQAEKEAAVAALATAQANVTSRTADIAAARAAVDAQVANVRRFEQIQAFQRVVAPFDGVVTERRVEKGDLISEGSSGDRNLFSVAQGKTLRIQVSVPQTYALDLKPGQNAQITVRELPGDKFVGRVTRTAGSITSGSRTLLTEVQVDNSSGQLLPGMYGEVTFALPRSHPTMLIVGSALIVNSEGMRVAQVRPDHRVQLLPVQVGRDLGSEVEIVSGLSGSEDVIANPPDTLTDGQEVQVASAEEKQ